MFKSALEGANKWWENRLDVTRGRPYLNEVHQKQINLEIADCMVLKWFKWFHKQHLKNDITDSMSLVVDSV